MNNISRFTPGRKAAFLPGSPQIARRAFLDANSPHVRPRVLQRSQPLRTETVATATESPTKVEQRTWKQTAWAFLTPFRGKEGAFSAVALSAVIPGFVYGPHLFVQTAVLGLTALGLREYFNLTFPRLRRLDPKDPNDQYSAVELNREAQSREFRRFGTVCGLIFGATLFAPPAYFSSTLAGAMFTVSAYFMFKAQTDPKLAVRGWRKVMTGLIYVPVLFAHLHYLHGLENGALWAISAVVVKTASDMLAKAFGCAWGKHKLIPLISPKKTWEGMIGQFLGAVAGSTLMVYGFMGEFAGLLDVMALTIAGTVIGPIGDLVESVLKRSYNIKDSHHSSKDDVHDTKKNGSLATSHGGLLDLVDSLLFIGPVVYGWAAFVRTFLGLGL